MKWFLNSAGAALALTGLAKAFSAIGPARALDVADPVIGIPFRQLLLLVGLLELFIAFFCLFTERRRFSVLAVGWIATDFLVYRLGLWFIGWHRPCGCMGNLTDLLHISPQLADNTMKVVLAYLLVGSYGILLWEWRRRRAERSARGVAVQRPEESELDELGRDCGPAGAFDRHRACALGPPVSEIGCPQARAGRQEIAEGREVTHL
jgi:hypothetical protein